MVDFLVSLLGVSLIMGIVSIFMWGFKGKLRKVFKGSSRYLLWVLVIFRLCVPVSLFGGNALIEFPIPEGISEQGEETLVAETVGSIVETQSPDHIANNEVTIPDTPIFQGNPTVETIVENVIPSVSAPDGVVENITPVTPSVTEENVWGSGETAPSVTVNGGTSDYAEPFETNMGFENITPTEPVIEKSGRGIDPIKAVFCIWLAGAVFFLLIEMIEYVRFLENLNSTTDMADSVLSKIYLDVCGRMKIKNPPKLYVSQKVTSPMLVGLIKPMIILPIFDLKESAWEGIIVHELTHYKRGDIWAKLLGVIAKSVHWFNPAAHLAVGMLNEEMELSCDESALKNVTDEGRIEYGTVMVAILKKCKGKVNAFSTQFNPNKNTAKGRIMNILDSTKKRKGITLIILSLIICVVAGSVFGCVREVKKNNPTNDETKQEDKEHICEFKKLDAITATCIDYGTVGGEKCIGCGKEKEAPQIINALGHEFENNVCTRCGEKASENLEFKSNGDGTCTLVSMGTCRDAVFNVPSVSPDGEKVTAIGGGFKSYHFIETLVLPNTVKRIEPLALNELSNMKKIVLPQSLNFIGINVLYNCDKLESVVIPKGVTFIGEGLLKDSGGLTEFLVEKDNTVYGSVGNCLVELNNKEVVMAYASSYLPENCGIVAIGEGAFMNLTTLTSLVIPEGVTYIGNRAFMGCTGLEKIQFPSTLKSVGEYAFSNCVKLESIELPQSLVSISTGMFGSCSGLKNVKIPQTVSSIQLFAFEECHSLTSVTFDEVDNWYSIDDYIEYKADLSHPENNAQLLKGIGARLQFKCDSNKTDLREKLDYEKIVYSKKAETVNWEYPTDGTVAEKNGKGEYSYIKFYSNNDKWTLSYSNSPKSVLTLTDGKREYSYGSDSAVISNRFPFYPISGEKSAAVLISPDEKYAAIIHYVPAMTSGNVDSKAIRVVDLEKGSSVQYIDVNISQLCYTNECSLWVVREYGGSLYETPLNHPLYTVNMVAQFTDSDSLFIQRQVLSFDGKLRLYDEGTYKISSYSVGGLFKAEGEYDRYIVAEEDRELEEKMVEVTYFPNMFAKDLFDGSDSTDLREYNLTLNVPAVWKNDSPIFHNTEPKADGVSVSNVFSVDRYFEFQDELINYARPITDYTADNPPVPVKLPHDLKSMSIERGVTKQGYKYIAYDRSLFYLRVDEELVWEISFSSGYSELDDKVKNSIVDSVKLNITNEKKSASTVEGIMHLDADESIKKMVKAFLTKDTAVMEDLANYKPGTLDPYKEFEFGEFQATVIGDSNKKIELKVIIKKASERVSMVASDIPVVFVAELGLNGVLFDYTFITQAYYQQVNYYVEEPVFLANWFTSPYFGYELKKADEVPKEDLEAYSVWLYDFLYCYFRTVSPYSSDLHTANLCKKYAEEVFGLTDHTGFERVFKEDNNGNLAYMHGHGGGRMSYSFGGYNILDENGDRKLGFANGDYSYGASETFVQLYADAGCTVKSHLVKYTLTPGEVIPTSFKYEIIEKSPYEPYRG